MNIHNLVEWIKSVGLSGFLDMAILALLIYAVLVWFKTTRAARVLTGIVVVALAYLLVRQFNLTMTAKVFENFFAVILVAIVVIFQEELRSFFERVAQWSTRKRRFIKQASARSQRKSIQMLARTCADLAKRKTGALIILKGRDIIARHIEGGIDLGGRISEPLLLSLFDASSPGHDGAVVIDDEKVTHFATHLPLSRNLHEVGQGGTRHAAGLGLAELCDALCLIVSEERGTISVAKNSRLKTVEGAEELTGILDKFYQEIDPPKKPKVWEDYLKRNYREKIIALCLAVGLWFVNVHSSKIIYRTFSVPVSHVEVSKDWAIEELNPSVVQVTFHAPRSAFYFVDKNNLRLLVKMKTSEGLQRIRLFSDNLTYPKSFALDHFDPLYVDVHLKKKPQTPPKTTSS